MKKIALTLFIALLALPVMAEEWEYKVVHVPFHTDPSKYKEGITYSVLPDGSAEDIEKASVMNRLAKEGWELVSVVGHVNNHALYLRRRVPQ